MIARRACGCGQVFREDKPARKVTALADVELVSWEKIEDLSEDKKGGLLLKVRNATFCAIYI